jgi:hypothetical protein
MATLMREYKEESMMYDEEMVLAMASTYDKKYYLNNEFEQLPQSVKDELKILCVTHVAEVGGIISLLFDEEGNLLIQAFADEEDILYDEIGSQLKIKQYQRAKRDLFESLETFFKVFYIEEG